VVRNRHQYHWPTKTPPAIARLGFCLAAQKREPGGAARAIQQIRLTASVQAKQGAFNKLSMAAQSCSSRSLFGVN